jgi:hypothetical protein
MDIKKLLVGLGVVAALVGVWWAVKALTGGGC